MSRPNYKQQHNYTEAEYLDFEQHSDSKHEYFDGEIFAMAGASKSHQRIISNLVINIGAHLKNTPCEVFSSDMKVRADNGNKYFYPDVLVGCDNNETDDYYVESPRIIVEVLSNSTRKFDKDLKRKIYQTIPSLEEYVLIEQDRVEIEICRKNAHWKSTFYFLDDDITFESIDLTLRISEIYQRVDNEDMRHFLQTHQTQPIE